METAADFSPFLPKIKKIDAFRYLGEDELKAILSLSDIVVYAPGEKIITQGDIGEFFFAVIDGQVDISIQQLNKPGVILSTLASGEIFGESAIFLKEERTATVTSSQETVVIRIHRQNMLSFFKSNAHAGNKVLMIIVLGLLIRLKNTNQELAFEKQPDIDFDYVDSLVEDFMKEI
ncbi:MAG: cyclic nucleotide-binding domain-containing protein [Desulfobacterales bacterium]|nr:cyclic nucleotide-binding domain-containing protein [Desulfobacterales bacterium]